MDKDTSFHSDSWEFFIFNNNHNVLKKYNKAIKTVTSIFPFIEWKYSIESNSRILFVFIGKIPSSKNSYIRIEYCPKTEYFGNDNISFIVFKDNLKYVEKEYPLYSDRKSKCRARRNASSPKTD